MKNNFQILAVTEKQEAHSTRALTHPFCIKYELELYFQTLTRLPFESKQEFARQTCRFLLKALLVIIKVKKTLISLTYKQDQFWSACLYRKD
jgi:hypothetical protein